MDDDDGEIVSTIDDSVDADAGVCIRTTTTKKDIVLTYRFGLIIAVNGREADDKKESGARWEEMWCEMMDATCSRNSLAR